MAAEKRRYDAISGVRVIMSVWVMLLHVSMLITALTHDSDTALIFNTLPWVNALKHFGCQVDVFFAISGFLITTSILDDSQSAAQPVRTTVAWIVKRMLRMWPAMLLTVFFGWLVSDYNVNIPVLLYKTFTFTSNVDPNSVPFSYIVSWSNSVDVKVGAFLCLVVALAKRYGLLKQSLMHILLGISVLVVLVALMQDRDEAGVLAFMAKNIFRVGWTTEQQTWVRDTFQTGVPIKPSLEQQAARILYLSSWARCGPMFIGSALALRLRESDRDPKPRAWWRVIITTFVLLLALIPAKPITTTPKEYVRPPLLGEIFISVLLRPLVAFAWCEILYSALVAPSHPAHSAWIDKVLSWRPFQMLADYTHPFYLFHFRICLSTVMFSLHPTRKHIWAPVLGEQFGFAHQFVCSLLGLLATGAAAYLVHQFCEKPVWRRRDIVLKSLGLVSRGAQESAAGGVQKDKTKSE